MLGIKNNTKYQYSASVKKTCNGKRKLFCIHMSSNQSFVISKIYWRLTLVVCIHVKWTLFCLTVIQPSTKTSGKLSIDYIEWSEEQLKQIQLSPVHWGKLSITSSFWAIRKCKHLNIYINKMHVGICIQTVYYDKICNFLPLCFLKNITCVCVWNI